ncbi:MAG TPA: branched-chain amino acid ABC transporter permease [Mycobacteriales bacterium]|jgi:branched-chain amino acid transport system permease protein|nr:branched-chain amino acid ABC transporter permease [Mycobacteriales bacterium]
MTFLNLVIYGIANGTLYAAVALALVLIWRSTRVVNFAQGGMLMFTTFIAWELVAKHGVNYWLGLIVALVAGFVMGAVAERLLVRPVENGPPLNPVIVTLGLLLLLQSVAGMIWGNGLSSFAPQFSLNYYHVGHQVILFSPDYLFIVLAVLVVLVLLYLLFQRSPLGLRMRASAFSPEVARLLGVRVGRMLTLGWGLAAVVGALAGVLIAGTQPDYMNPNAFDPLLIFGFTAAVIGGLDSPGGAVVGGVTVGVILQLLDNYVSNNIDAFYIFAVLLIVLMVRPNGLFSRTTVRRV